MRLTFKGTAQLPEYRGWHDGRFVHIKPGEAIEISDTAGAETLIRDFPANFGPERPQTQALDGPPVDKMIRGARKK